MRIRSILLFCLAPFAIAALQGCGGDDGNDSSSSGNSSGGPLGECPPDSAAQQAAGYDALQGECAVCHGTDKVGATRIGAPDGTNVDDPDWVRAEAVEIMDQIETGKMPFAAGKLPDDTIEAIRVYLACDAAAQ